MLKKRILIVNTRLTIFCFASAMMAISQTHAETFSIEKAAPTSNAQLAIVPFANTDITNIVSNDLTHLGQINATTNLPEQPHNSSEVNLTAWQQIGVPYLVVGSNSPAGSNSVVGFEVIDINKNNNMGRFSQPMRGDINGKRLAGHKIADKIYELLTGIKGDFSGKIAYIRENGVGKNKVSSLMLMDVDGANPTVLYAINGSIESLSASHDGRKLAFTTQGNGYPIVNVLDIASKGVTPITPFKANNGGGSFSPDDSRVLFSSDKDSVTSGIYVASVGGGTPQRITNQTGNGRGNDISPYWSPDANVFYYVSDPVGNNRPQIFRYTFSTNASQAVTGAGGYNADVHVSNDGKKLAYLASTSQGVVREGGSVRGVNNTSLNEAPNFSPNSQHLVYSSGSTITIVSNGLSSSINPSTTGGGRGVIRKPVWLKATE